MPIFNELTFAVKEKVFFDVFKNCDKGFGFNIKIKESDLSAIQKETFKYLSTCHEKKLLGSITLKFTTEGVGEIDTLSRRVEKITFENNTYILISTY